MNTNLLKSLQNYPCERCKYLEYVWYEVDNEIIGKRDFGNGQKMMFILRNLNDVYTGRFELIGLEIELKEPFLFFEIGNKNENVNFTSISIYSWLLDAEGTFFSDLGIHENAFYDKHF